MIDRDAPLPKCWAFNGDGLRCMQIAGHTGPHAHAIEWSDDESWSPDMEMARLTRPQPVHTPVDPMPLTVAESPTSDRCEICEHPWHDGRCGAPDGEYTCDCAQAI